MVDVAGQNDGIGVLVCIVETRRRVVLEVKVAQDSKAHALEERRGNETRGRYGGAPK
jgi:hypothetical protein